MGWNAGLGVFAIAQFGGNVYFPFVAHAHVLHGDDPAFDQLVEAESDRHAAEAAVKFLAVDGTAGIMDCDDTPLRGMLSVIRAGTDHPVIYPFGKRFDAIFLGLGFQPFLVGKCIFFLVHTVYNAMRK